MINVYPKTMTIPNEKLSLISDNTGIGVKTKISDFYIDLEIQRAELPNIMQEIKNYLLDNYFLDDDDAGSVFKVRIHKPHETPFKY